MSNPFDVFDNASLQQQAPPLQQAQQPQANPFDQFDEGPTSAVSAFAQGAGQGITFGFSDEIEGGVRGAYDALTSDASFNDAYTARLEAARERLRKAREDQPVAAYGGEIVSSMALPLGAVRGATVAARAGSAAFQGARFGALHGLGSGEGGIENRATNAALGGVVGGMAGGVLAPVADGIGAAGRGLSDAWVRNQALKNAAIRFAPDGRKVSPGAIDRVTQGFVQDFGPDTANLRAAYQARAAQAVPEETLADFGSNLRQQAETIAAQPGQGQKIIDRVLTARARQSSQRIDNAVNQSLGRPVDLAQTADDIARQSQAQAKPLYDEFYQTQVQATGQLDDVVARAQALYPSADRNARRLLAADGKDANNTAAYYDYLKRALDDYGQRVSRSGDANQARIAGNLSKELRDQIDTVLGSGDPTRSVWKQARDVAGAGKQFQQGLDEGRDVFSDRVSADQFRFDQARRPAPQQQGVRMQAREELRRRMQTAKSSVDMQQDASGATARKLLSSPETRSKMQQIIGPDASAVLNRTLDAEGRMAATRSGVLQGSQTARRLAAAELYPSHANANVIASSVGQKGPIGLATEAGYRIVNSLFRGANSEKNARVAHDAAYLLMQQGNSREVVAEAIIKQARLKGATEEQLRKINLGIELALQRAARGATAAAF